MSDESRKIKISDFLNFRGSSKNDEIDPPVGGLVLRDYELRVRKATPETKPKKVAEALEATLKDGNELRVKSPEK